MSEGEWGKFIKWTSVDTSTHEVWHVVGETYEDDPDAQPRKIALFTNGYDAESYVNWRNTVWDDLYTCPDCGHREPTDPGCSNCARDGQR